MLISTISNFVGFGKTTNVEIKRMLMSAALLSLLAAILLGIGAFLTHRLSVVLLIFAGLLVLVSGIISTAAAAKIRGQQNKSGYAPTVLASGMSFIALVLVCIVCLLALMSNRGQRLQQIGMVGVPPKLKTPYGTGDTAEQQLRELQIGSGVLQTASTGLQ